MTALTPSLADPSYKLEDRYTRRNGRVILTGIQALVRLPMMQRRIDEAMGHNTAGLISGYRGSPLGGYDQALWQTEALLNDHHVKFEPGINEDLGATMVWGTQRLNFYPDAKYDGVFGIWYGKGPGVDRTLDVLRHANFAGTAELGGILALAGDDHAASSSVFPHQTDHVFESAMIPLLNPADLRDVLEFGLAGIALSRFSGCWVGMKAISDIIESTAVIDLDTLVTDYAPPADYAYPPRTLNADPHAPWPAKRELFEERLINDRLPAAIAFARANRLNRRICGADDAPLGIITTGKAHTDLMEILAQAGITPETLADAGIALYKVGMSWPLDGEDIRRFATGKKSLLVVEEKRAFVERQVKEALFELPSHTHPSVWGKTCPDSQPLITPLMHLSPAQVGAAFSRWVAAEGADSQAADLGTRVAAVQPQPLADTAPAPLARKPFFCAGCPHNRSTVVPEGSYGGAGIGCHIMVMGQNRNTEVITHMGAEGTNWVGLAPFTNIPHQFQNMGDGTYQHSGLLAIRQAVAAGTNITFKILYNDAVAMTGGQTNDGGVLPHEIAHQVRAERVERIAVIGDEPEALDRALYPAGTTFHHRDDLDLVQRELRDIAGVTLIVYVQTCATEKRRRRKRGKMPTPDARLFINPRVCEGCGDCSVKSNCIAVEPVDTPFGRKRRINQSSCNMDMSCQQGFCPSFVSVEGAELRTPAEDVFARAGIDLSVPLPEPTPQVDGGVYGILVTGVGGTGVVTIGALLSMAAHLEKKNATVLDHTGLAQKNGAVVSHVRIADADTPIFAPHIPDARTDLLLGCDLVVASGNDTLAACDPARTRAVVATDEAPTADFVKDQNIRFPGPDLADRIATRVKEQDRIPAAKWAETLLGTTTAANLFLVGVAYQKGLIPVSAAAILRAVQLNGTAVKMNERAFALGRLAATDLEGFAAKVASVLTPPEEPEPETEVLIKRYAAELSAYANAAYAKRFTDRMDALRSMELAYKPGADALTRTVAKSYYKLLAYKDEYEVARLYTDPAFLQNLTGQFQTHKKLRLQLAPPLLARKDPVTGQPRKMSFGPWVFSVFKLLTKLKGLRGTPLDIFGYTAERRMERGLIRQYEAWLDGLSAPTSQEAYQALLTRAALPQEIRGYGHVKDKSVAIFRKKWDAQAEK